MRLTRSKPFVVLLGIGLCAVLAANQPARPRAELGAAVRGNATDTPTPLQSGTPTPTRTLPPTPTQGVNPLRNPYFGDMHVHTNRSFDASVVNNPNGPEEAYRFARGATITLAGGVQTLQISKPLDWMAVTDHAEYFGEVGICTEPGHAGYNLPLCVAFRAASEMPLERLEGVLFGIFGVKLSQPNPQRFQPLCGQNDQNCRQEARTVWQDYKDIADTFNRPGVFTTFLGYEYTGTPLSNDVGDPIQMNHRNVIFRGTAGTPDLPVTYFEAQTAPQLWALLRLLCNGDCQFLAVPHNPNYSNGVMFAPENPNGTPMTVPQALLRAASEPLVEIVQYKGDSECHPGLGTEDELCGFEKVNPVTRCQPGDPPSDDCFVECDEDGKPDGCLYRRNFVRNALKLGLGIQEAIGVNPFRLGFIGSMDTHNSAGGNAEEDNQKGHHGATDDTPVERLDMCTVNLLHSSGGLAVVWAEQNTRESIFDAMKRRETYATSGTRPIVRFFGGWAYPADLCGRIDVIQQAYDGGVPMGGILPYPAGQAPKFLGFVLKEPDGSNLDKIQLVKGWTVGSEGHEAVYDMACSDGRVPDAVTHQCPPTSASVNLDDCSPGEGLGAAQLCAVMEDPDFDSEQNAFYYLRAIELPTCRWSQRDCNAQYPTLSCDAVFTQQGLDPCNLYYNAMDPNDPNNVAADVYSQAGCCCSRVPKTIQERAWASPIWYNPRVVGATDEDVMLALVGLGLLTGTWRLRRRRA